MIDQGWLDLAVHACGELLADVRDPQQRGVRVLAELDKRLRASEDAYLLALANDVWSTRLSRS